ncbi:RNA ligase-domain-containing protein [Phycomyces nitens]|nr:RNA ligase-domain-containing protein [Phycomyces nitens]
MANLSIVLPDANFIDLGNDHAVIEKLYAHLAAKPKELRNRPFDLQNDTWTSWTVRESVYKRSQGSFPIMARGLFTIIRDNTHRIAARGYDKFFNINETKYTQWPALENDTQGPYEITAKENGCIIFIAALTTQTLIVTSKHSIPTNGDPQSHGGVGYRWLQKHLESVQVSEQDLSAWLWSNSITLIAELCDDEFEEHILAYPRHKSGLYLHGANYNTSNLHTLPSQAVRQIADSFGLWPVEFTTVATIDQVKDLANKVQLTGMFNDREIEGIVVRCKRQGNVFMFKVKSEPYLVYRDYREVTKSVLANPDITPKYTYPKAYYYWQWIQHRLKDHPEWFEDYAISKGIINVRQKFEDYWQTGDLTLPAIS